MIARFIDRLRVWFRLAPDFGTVQITPYTSLHFGDTLTEELVARKKLIASKLRSYEERMVEYHREHTVPVRGILYLRLQRISASWDVNADRLSVLVCGDRVFRWQGTVDSFLGDGLNVPLLQES